MKLLDKYKPLIGKDSTVSLSFLQAACLSKDAKQVLAVLTEIGTKAVRPAVAVPALKFANSAGFAVEVADVAGNLSKRFPDYDRDLAEVTARSNFIAAEPKAGEIEWNAKRVRSRRAGLRTVVARRSERYRFRRFVGVVAVESNAPQRRR